MSQIHVVKIKQNRMYKKIKGGGSFEYFPFDRVYLLQPKQTSIIKKLFKYSFVLKVDSQLTEILQYLTPIRTRHIGLQRNDADLAWKKPDSNPLAFLNDSTWLMVVPTYAYKSKVTDKHPVKLAYVITAAINTIHNLKVQLPTVMLQTPRGQVPLMCSACTEVPTYYAGKCTPGRAACRAKMDIPTLELDNTFKETRQQSIDEAGAIK